MVCVGVGAWLLFDGCVHVPDWMCALYVRHACVTSQAPTAHPPTHPLTYPSPTRRR